MNHNEPEQSQAEFTRKQFEFAAHIRNPELNPCPDGIEDRRMAIYRELFYNNIDGFISDGFPVLRSLYDDENWHQMIRDFYSAHKSKTPYFAKVVEEFLEYLNDERDNPNDPAFLNELAHYEWVELALSISELEIPTKGINPDGNLLTGIPVLSPLAWLLNYEFDVHHISPDYQPDTAPDTTTILIVYRKHDDEVGFTEINPITAHLIQSLQLDPDQTGKQILETIAKQLNHPDPGVVITGGHEIMNQLRDSEILLGTRDI